MVRRFGMLKYYIYLLIFLVSLNADCGSFSEEVLLLSVAQKDKINQNIEQLQIELKSEKNTSQIAKLEKSLAMYESRLENPTQYLRRLQQQREYYQRDDIKEKKREYQQEYLQRDDVKKIKREYLQEYRQRDYAKERHRKYQREYYHQKKSKSNHVTESEERSTFSSNIESEIDSWLSLDNFQQKSPIQTTEYCY